MAKIPCVQKAWVKGQPVRIHGLIYRLEDGILNDLGLTLDRIQQIPEEFWIYSPEEKQEKKVEIKVGEGAFRKNTEFEAGVDSK